MPLAPDAPGDNQLVYTALGPGLTQPCDSTRISLLGSMRWFIAGNSQVKYVMRSWLVTCGKVPSMNEISEVQSSHSLSLVNLGLYSDYFSHLECSSSFCFAGFFSMFSIISNVSPSDGPSLATPISQVQSLIHSKSPQTLTAFPSVLFMGTFRACNY